MKLAFLGPQGSGKTTMAKATIEEANQFGEFDYIAHLSFADALRVEVMEILKARKIFDAGSTPDMLRDPVYKLRYRPLLQAWGALRRELNINYWRDIVLNDIAQIDREWEHPLLVIDDCRYFNEYDGLKDAGFRFVRLGANPDYPTINVTHESERDWPQMPYHVYLNWVPTEDRINQLTQVKDWIE